MKIGIISDSHEGRYYIDLVMEQLKEVDLIIHAGDGYKDTEYIEHKYGIKILAVKGNCDLEGPEQRIEIIENKRVFIAHGDRYGVVSNIDRIFYAAKECEADIAIFGHTHVPFYTVEEGIVIINPGSISLPRGDSQRGYCMLTLEEDIKVEFIKI